jgi:hypothetical protein
MVEIPRVCGKSSPHQKHLVCESSNPLLAGATNQSVTAADCKGIFESLRLRRDARSLHNLGNDLPILDRCRHGEADRLLP